MKNENFIIMVRMTAFLSFLIGSVLFLANHFNHGLQWMYIGLGYIVIAVIINSLVFLFALIQAAIYSKEGPQLFFNSLLMLLNIPVVIIYITLL
jgi:uncharacterized membrane protein YhfC